MIRSNKGLERLLWPQAGGWTGPERVQRLPDGITLYADDFGSYRFVLAKQGTPIAAIQVLSRGLSGPGLVVNVFTLPEHRRQGHCRRLVQEALRFGPLVFSRDRSEDGQALVASVFPHEREGALLWSMPFSEKQHEAAELAKHV